MFNIVTDRYVIHDDHLEIKLVVLYCIVEEMIQIGLKSLKEVLPEGAFYGSGFDGPKVIMTDDSQAERSAIHAVWPSCVRLLCVFHVVQAVGEEAWNRTRPSPSSTHTPESHTLITLIYSHS